MQKRLGWRFNQRHSIPDWIEHRYDGLRYARRVLVTRPQNLVGYWPMWEGNGVVSFDNSPQGNDGAYTGVTLAQPGIGDGRYSPFFDGVNDFNNIYSLGLNADLNGAELTFGIWLDPTVGWWTDGNTYVLGSARVNNANVAFEIFKAANNILTFVRNGGGVSESFNVAGYTSEDWMLHAVTTSESAGVDGEFRGYSAGVQVGATQTGLGAYVGNLDPIRCTLGAETTAPAFPILGNEAHAFLYNVALTQPEIAFLSTLG